MEKRLVFGVWVLQLKVWKITATIRTKLEKAGQERTEKTLQVIGITMTTLCHVTYFLFRSVASE